MTVAMLPIPAQGQANSAVVFIGDPQQTIGSVKKSTPLANEEYRDWKEVEVQPRVEPSVSAAGAPPGAEVTSQGEGMILPFPFVGYWREPARFTISETARHRLTDRVREVLAGLEPFLASVAQKNYMPVHKVEVSGFSDPDEDRDEVVITQWVDVNFEEALQYWDRLGLAIERWTESLSRTLADIVVQRIAIEVRSSR